VVKKVRNKIVDWAWPNIMPYKDRGRGGDPSYICK